MQLRKKNYVFSLWGLGFHSLDARLRKWKNAKMLPFHSDDPVTKSLKNNPELWKECAVGLCRKHQIPVTKFSSFTSGSSLVAAVSDIAVIKIIQPPFLNEYKAELWALKNLPETHIRTPKLLASGVDESGWSYLIMTKVPGTQMDHVWPHMTFENQKSIMHEIGSLMAEVHRKSDLTETNWKAFIGTQKKNCVERHKKLGMPDWFVNGISDYLLEVPIPENIRPVLLTGEYTPFNLLVEKGKLTGMVDFADSFSGMAEYDLIGPGVFLGAGNHALIESLFNGYGSRPDSKLLMALHLLHRFSNFRTQVALKDWDKKASTLHELEKLLWP